MARGVLNVRLEQFNMNFTNITNSIVSDINPSDHAYRIEDLPETGPLFSFTENLLSDVEILNVSNQLISKNSLDYLNLSVSFVEKILSNILVPILHLFSFSLHTGFVPQQLNIAKV
jgi:hypothetical protein